MTRSTFWRLACVGLLLFWGSLFALMHKAHAEIICPGFVMTFGTHYATSIAPTGKIRFYPLIKDDDAGDTYATPYGMVRVTNGFPPLVIWTNTNGDIVPQECAYPDGD